MSKKTSKEWHSLQEGQEVFIEINDEQIPLKIVKILDGDAPGSKNIQMEYLQPLPEKTADVELTISEMETIIYVHDTYHIPCQFSDKMMNKIKAALRWTKGDIDA